MSMPRWRAGLLAVLCALAASGAALAKDPPLSALTPEHFRDTATVRDNPAGDVTTITTERGYLVHTGLMRMVWNDEFLHGEIEHATGAKSFRVEAVIVYSGRFRSYDTVEYPSDDGARSVPAIRLATVSENCPVGDCTFTERVAFPVDEQYLRRLAAGGSPGKPQLWSFKLLATSGPAYAGELSSAEIAGFLARVDAYAEATPAVAAAAAGASLKLDLGIGGLAVDAEPDRAGVLVTQVTRGAAGQRGGLLVGDIIHRFDGHPTQSLPELQAAVAGCGAARCSRAGGVAVQVYRGATDVTLHVTP